MGKLILVGTPIGNYQDLSIRSINYLKDAKHIIAENPEFFEELLKNMKIENLQANVMYAHTWPEYIGDKPLIPDVLKILKSGEDVYMVCDRGMPGIADPGSNLIKACIKEKIQVIATPGPSAIITAAVVTNCTSGFMFGGFIPKDDKQRASFLAHFQTNIFPTIFLLVNMYDGRDVQDEFMVESLDFMIKNWGDRNGALCYNLTTNREHVVHGRLSQLKNHYIEHYGQNEIILVVDGVPQTLTMP